MDKVVAPLGRKYADRIEVEYNKLCGDGYSRDITALPLDSARMLLFSASVSLYYGPSVESLMQVKRALSIPIGNRLAIFYILMHDPATIAENAVLVLVRVSPEEARLFSMETHRNKYFLCEYAGSRQINYGEVAAEKFEERLGEILDKDCG